MQRALTIGNVQFDIPNIRQTALHVMNAKACKESLTQEQVETHLKECALAAINNGENDRDKMIVVKDMQAYFVVEDFENSNFDAIAPHRYEVNFFVRVGHRQER